MRKYLYLLLAMTLCLGCGEKDQPDNGGDTPEPTPSYTRPIITKFYKGTTMSFASFEQDLGLVYRENGQVTDPYKSVKNHGANIVRLQLDQISFEKYSGVTVDWQGYNRVLADAKKAKAEGLDIFLTLKPDYDTYSDTSADHNLLPSIWKSKTDVQIGEVLYEWVYSTLEKLSKEGINPAFVAVGNEVNLGFLKPSATSGIDAARTGKLLAYGWKAVREYAKTYNKNCAIAVHIANPSRAESAISDIVKAGGDEFDVVALSYYPAKSIGHTLPYNTVSTTVSELKKKTSKQVMVLEASYSFTDGYKDSKWAGDYCDNSYYDPEWSNDAAVRASQYSPAKQRAWLKDLAEQVKSGGGVGLITWGTESLPDELSGKEEGHGKGLYTYPAKWAYGSTWENNSYWDFTNNNNLHEGIDWMKDISE